MKNMFEINKKDPDAEISEIISIQNEQEIPQLPKLPETIGKVDRSQTEELPNATKVLDLLTILQEMRTEEQKLLGIRQHLLTTQQDLCIKLAKEIDKKKETIANLTIEIPHLQNKCHQIGEVLGVDIYK
jgi:hypothetical protein